MRIKRTPREALTPSLSPCGFNTPAAAPIICSYLPSKHDIKVVRRLPLAVDVLPFDVTMVRHAVGERPDL